MTTYESIKHLLTASTGTVVGSDECGLGSWCGPLVVCAVAAPITWPGDPMVKDSKKLSPVQRKAVYDKYWLDDRFVISPVIVDSDEIDNIGIKTALVQAHKKAIEGTYWRLVYEPLVIVDGIVDPGVPGCICLPKADDLVPVVSLASCIGKHIHDTKMAEYDKMYPGYGLSKNSGYGTAGHRSALAKLGPCPIHRKSYAPIAKLLEETETHDLFREVFID